jgi:DNA-binding CsgD family transcriptional regulator
MMGVAHAYRGTASELTAATAPGRADQGLEFSRGAGLIILDGSLNPIAYNTEAVQILTHPRAAQEGGGIEAHLGQKIRSSLLVDRAPSGRPSFASEFNSGGRKYVCRCFDLSTDASRLWGGAVALLLERKSDGNLVLDRMVQQYNLTHRERETLRHLLKGLTSKEIAAQMNISSNTVKCFLRLVMTKMGVATRAGIIGKVVACGYD